MARFSAKPKAAAVDPAVAVAQAERAKRANKAPATPEEYKAQLKALRTQERALRDAAKAAGVEIKRDAPTFTEDAAHGALLSARFEEQDGVECVVLTFRLGDGSLTTKDGRVYALNVTAGRGSAPLNIEGMDGDWASGGMYILQPKAQ